MKYTLFFISISLNVLNSQGYNDNGSFIIPQAEQWNLESMIKKNGLLFAPQSMKPFDGMVFEMDGFGNVTAERYYQSGAFNGYENRICLLYTSPSPRD